MQVVDDHQLRLVRGLVGQHALDPLVQSEPGRRAVGGARGDPRAARPAQHLQPRPQRRGALALPAGAPRHLRPGGAPGAGPGQVGLAHARLPGQQHNATSPGRGLPDQRVQDGKLRLSAYQHASVPPTLGR